MLAEHRAQSGLGEHVGGGQIVLNPNDGALGIDDAEIEDRVDLDRHIVVRDHVLAWNFDHLDAQIDPHHFLDKRNQQDQSGSGYA